MSEYGIRIKNFEAGALYGVNCGVRSCYDFTEAMLTNSLFSDFITKHGLRVGKGRSTKDIICIEFNYGSRSYEEEVDHLKKTIKQTYKDNRLSRTAKETKIGKLNELVEFAKAHEGLYDKKTAEELRELFYVNGVPIKYTTKNRNGKIVEEETITYKMLYRTPGKAKKGTCMFINEELYDVAKNFLWMGLTLPYHNAPIVEVGAYSSLITSSIVGTIKIDPKNILIVSDVDAFFETKVVCIETDEKKCCRARDIEKYKLKNTLFDGQALIDHSIFPEWGDGYILLRHHFCKMAAFDTNIQLFLKDYYGEEYETAVVEDMWGNKVRVKDIKLITTDNAVKWIKFGVSYDYWSAKVRENGCLFGIVKTAHKSKLGEVQRMSYQMVNALNIPIMENVCSTTVDYINKLKTDDKVFLSYLEDNINFANDFEVLIALCKQNSDFTKSEYFRERRQAIIRAYVLNFQNGRAIQNADNLVIVGSPYAMLLHAVGEDIAKDDTFKCEEGTIQCCTKRFENGEYLAEFRNPFNSKNNLGYLHNVYNKKLDRYFNLGKLIIAVNMIGTDFQDRNNGSDQDSDSIYTTNQADIVEYAKYCYINYPTIVNNIPKEKNHYDNELINFARIDNGLAASQLAIGESSNLAQIALTYTYNFKDKKFSDYVCILSVLAQVAIDSAKRRFDINLPEEIKRIKKDMDIKTNKYPIFWTSIRKDFNKRAEDAVRDLKILNEDGEVPKKFEDSGLSCLEIDKVLRENYANTNKINSHLKCPMNYICNLKMSRINLEGKPLPMSEFFIKHPIDKNKRRQCKKVEDLIQEYSLNLYNNWQSNINTPGEESSYDDDRVLLLRDDFDNLIHDIQAVNISGNYIGLMSWMIDRAFCITRGAKQNHHSLKSNIDKNRSILLKALYSSNKKAFLQCFKKKEDK